MQLLDQVWIWIQVPPNSIRFSFWSCRVGSKSDPGPAPVKSLWIWRHLRPNQLTALWTSIIFNDINFNIAFYHASEVLRWFPGLLCLISLFNAQHLQRDIVCILILVGKQAQSMLPFLDSMSCSGLSMLLYYCSFLRKKISTALLLVMYAWSGVLLIIMIAINYMKYFSLMPSFFIWIRRCSPTLTSKRSTHNLDV